MAKIKTTQTKVSVTKFINDVPDETKRNDSFRIIEIMKGVTGFDPKMWGPSIIGFGSYHYKYESGHEGDMPLVAFSPRKPAIVLYIGAGEKNEELLKKLGKYKRTKGCVYVKRLEDIDVKILKEMIKESVKHTKSLYK